MYLLVTKREKNIFVCSTVDVRAKENHNFDQIYSIYGKKKLEFGRYEEFSKWGKEQVTIYNNTL